MRTAVGLSLIAVLALAGCASGTSNNDSSSNFSGEERLVADVVEDLQSAAEDSDEREICGDLIVAKLRDEIAKNGDAATCVAAMEGALKDTDQSDLTVRSVRVNGDEASAVVRAKLSDGAHHDETLGMRKVAGAWKISRLPSS